MKDLGLPIWALSGVDDLGVYDIVEKYIALAQANENGTDAQSIAIDIGKIAQVKANLGDNLRALITKENCQKGIREFLKTFEDGKILDLAGEIKAEPTIIDDIRRLFNVERSYLWSKDTGLSEIRKLLTEYGIARETNAILFSAASSLKDAQSAWREKLKYTHISAETLRTKLPGPGKLIDFLSKIYEQNELLFDQLKSFLAELKTNGDKLADIIHDEKPLFAEVYEPYLDGLTDNVSEIIGKLPFGMFAITASDCNIKVKDEAEKFRKGQKKIELLTLWNNNTGSKNPKEWSTIHKCPILIMVIGRDYDKAKKTFETLNQTNPPGFAINDALAFLKSASFFDDLRSEEKRNEAFIKHVIGDYAKMLTVQAVKARLDRLTVDAYDWYPHPDVQAEIKKLAVAEYNAGGYDKVLGILNSMKPDKRDEFIRQLIKGNVEVGIKIITQGEN
jgi:hypothetical protein